MIEVQRDPELDAIMYKNFINAFYKNLLDFLKLKYDIVVAKKDGSAYIEISFEEFEKLYAEFVNCSFSNFKSG